MLNCRWREFWFGTVPSLILLPWVQARLRISEFMASNTHTLDVDKAAKKLLAKAGHDPQFGARPLKRAIQEHLLDPLATKLLAGEFKPGERIKVATNDGGLVFEKKKK